MSTSDPTRCSECGGRLEPSAYGGMIHADDADDTHRPRADQARAVNVPCPLCGQYQLVRHTDGRYECLNPLCDSNYPAKENDE